jgi:hypothetical protein
MIFSQMELFMLDDIKNPRNKSIPPANIQKTAAVKRRIRLDAVGLIV